MATPIPDNRAPFSLAQLVEATGATAVGGAEGAVQGISTDSRGDAAGKLFVALSGEHFDGHRYVEAAVERGAVAVLARRDRSVKVRVPVLEVDDTLGALGAIARVHRRRWGGRVVAVSGSAGKTTTRSAAAAALEAVAPGAVHAVRGNLNNRIGVPMVLLGLEERHRIAVVELGTNLRGEVAELTKVAEPDAGVLTLVALEHAEGLGSIDDIEAEEGDLLAAIAPSGAAIANADDERALRQLRRSLARRREAYGTSPKATYRIVRRRPSSGMRTRVEIERPMGVAREIVVLDSPLLGAPGALSIAAAVAVADCVADRPVDAPALAAALSAARLGEPGRLSPVELSDGTLVLDDTYNANPASCRASVETARELAEARRARLLLVVGEMLELGDQAAREHEALGRDLGPSGAAALVAVAGDAERMVAPARDAGLDATFAPDAERALDEVLERVAPGDVVLVKASRGVRAERVVEGLIEAKGRAA